MTTSEDCEWEFRPPAARTFEDLEPRVQDRIVDKLDTIVTDEMEYLGDDSSIYDIILGFCRKPLIQVLCFAIQIVWRTVLFDQFQHCRCDLVYWGTLVIEIKDPLVT